MVSVWPEPPNAKSAAPRAGVRLALLADGSGNISIRRICPAASTSDFNSRALTPTRGRLRLVRKSTRPRGGPERDVQQSVAAPRIADLLAIEIYELLATWAVGPLRCPGCVPLHLTAGHTGHPQPKVNTCSVGNMTLMREGQNGLRLNDIQRPKAPNRNSNGMIAAIPSDSRHDLLAIADTQNGLKKIAGRSNCIEFLNAHYKDRDCR
jgi:hypothetical protein